MVRPGASKRKRPSHAGEDAPKITWESWQRLVDGANLLAPRTEGEAHSTTERKRTAVLGRLHRSLVAVPMLRTEPRSLER